MRLCDPREHDGGDGDAARSFHRVRPRRAGEHDGRDAEPAKGSGGEGTDAAAAGPAADDEDALGGDDGDDRVGGDQPPAAEQLRPQRERGDASRRLDHDVVDDRAAAAPADAESLAVREPVGEDGAALDERLRVVDGSGHGPALPGKAPRETCGELRKSRGRPPGDDFRMTETNTRDGLALAFAALGVLVPTCFLLVIAISGGDVPRGSEFALFAVPAALLVGFLATGVKLFGR